MSEEEGAKRNTNTGHRRSSHELDEENSRLRNENFNLKLRLHFKVNAREDTTQCNEAMAKELKEAKSLIHALREELTDKTQLLKDAAVAISEHEEVENKFVLESQAKIAMLEGCLANMQHKEATSPAASYMALQVPDEPFEFKEVMRTHEEDLAKIESLRLQLAERDIKMEDFDQKLKELSAQNSDLRNLLQQHCRFSHMANKLMKMQRKELHDCLLEKLTFIKRINEILPELNCQNNMLKEATLVVQGLMETSDLKEQILIASKDEARKKGEGLLNWSQLPALESSAISYHSRASHINSDVLLTEVAGAQSTRPANASTDDVDADADADADDDGDGDAAKEVGGAASSQVHPSQGKPVLTHAKTSFTGLRQFVKCWGRRYSK